MRNELKRVLAACLGLAVIKVAAQPQIRPPQPSVPVEIPGMTNETEKVSYAVGMNFGTYLKRVNADVNVDVVASAIKDTLAGKAKMTEQQAAEVFRNFQRELAAKRQEEQHKQAEKNKKEGDAFLAENKGKEGVKVLEVKLGDTNVAELEYKVLKEGSGATPKSNDTVTVLYRGQLINGKEFDASTNAASPAKFQANRVIRGWTEALVQMKVGSKWQLFIPSSLAYGDFGHPPAIEPGSTLIFEVELLGVEPPPQAAAPPQPLTSDIIRVPSAEELKAGAKPEVIKAEDVEKLKAAAEKEQKKP